MSTKRDAEWWITALGLQPHPEGGYFREVTRSRHVVQNEAGSQRAAYTTIYFLLTRESPSHLHRLVSDETWLYHAGDSLQVHQFGNSTDAPTGAYRSTDIGLNVGQGEQLQYTVPGGCIFGSSVAAGGAAGFSLVSCIVSPGFDYRDFVLVTQAELLAAYPEHEDVIRRMAYETLPV